MELNKLNKNALAAAMRTGTECWGQVSSAAEHARYAQPVRPTSRRKCHCGCGQRATHLGMANGCALTMGCQLAIQRWIKTGSTPAKPLRHNAESNGAPAHPTRTPGYRAGTNEGD